MKRFLYYMAVTFAGIIFGLGLVSLFGALARLLVWLFG
jgi:hypothetical protein